MRILLIKFRNIGDILLISPLIDNLKYHFPNVKIDVAINSNCVDMLSENPKVDKIYKYNRDKIKQKSFFNRIKEEINFIKEIRKNKYDISINLTEGDRGAIISMLIPSKLKLGYPVRTKFLKRLKIFDKEAKELLFTHTINRDLQFIKLLNKDIIDKKLSIFWNKDVEENISKLLDFYDIGQFVQIHPVSRWMFKCWEEDKVATVIDYIQEKKNIKVILTSSNEKIELEAINRIMSLCKTNPVSLAGKINLKELAYLTSKSKFFFGVDSAPMHMACAVNKPVISLFGGSEPLYWGPWDNEYQEDYKNEDGIQKHGKNTIIAKISSKFVYLDGVKRSEGILKITLDEVIGVIDEYI